MFYCTSYTVYVHECLYVQFLFVCSTPSILQGSRVSQTDSDRDSTTVSYSLEEDRIKELDDQYPPQPNEPPPSYDESISVDDHQDLPPVKEMETSLIDDDEGRGSEDGVLGDTSLPRESSGDNIQTFKNREFPLTHYYELEGRVHTDQWSIPYKKEESLGVCMLATIEMMKEGYLEH